MKQNLDQIADEIRRHVAETDLALFHGFIKDLHEQELALWDIVAHPDFREFVDCAIRCGVKIVVFNHRLFDRGMAEEALEQLEESEMPREEMRALERRIRDLKPYDGFTSAIELSFEYQGRFFLFDLRTEWYEDFLDAVEEINNAIPEMGMDEEDHGPSMGGYFSRN